MNLLVADLLNHIIFTTLLKQQVGESYQNSLDVLLIYSNKVARLCDNIMQLI